MSDKAPRTDTSPRPFTVSAQAQDQLKKRQTRYWKRLQRRHLSQRRYQVRNMRARERSPIRGFLVTHRRQFYVAHKSVQPGETHADNM